MVYYAEYESYTTARYITIQEAVNDMVRYMIKNNITDEFKVYRTIHIDAKSIINPLCEMDILELIKSHTKEIYGDEAKDYLKYIDNEAYKKFSCMLNEYKKALTSWLMHYHLEPTWERIAATFVYKYDEENKIWKYVGEYIEVEPIEPDTPIEPEEPTEPTESDTPTEPIEEPIEESVGE